MKKFINILKGIVNFFIYLYTFMCISIVTLFIGGILLSGGSFTFFGKTFKSEGLVKKVTEIKK